MRTDQFLAHHGVARNPFAEEDAQTDRVFRSLSAEIRHPAWDKVCGDVEDPATSLVFGEKGAGKTAMRLQIADAIESHNESAESGQRAWVIEYDDFNPLLDRFADRLSSRKRREVRAVLSEWKLWDHMDGVLSIAVTDLVNRMLSPETPGQQIDQQAVSNLDRSQKRDLLLLAACYDDSTGESLGERWERLRKLIGYPRWRSWGWLAIGWAASLALLVGLIYAGMADWLTWPWTYLAFAAIWAPWLAKFTSRKLRARRVANHVRVLRRDRVALSRVLRKVRSEDLENQPLPEHRRTDDRYEMLGKLQGLLRSLGYGGVIVLVDRVDEPHLLGGRVDAMRDFVWPLLDNKFLRQPGIGIKLLLPAELLDQLNQESRDFHQRARIDKQNLVPSLDWTAETLADLADARLQACAEGGAKPRVRDLIDPAVSDARLADAIRMLRTPRHLFRFLFRLLTMHCSRHTDAEPVWQVQPDTFEAVLAVYSKEQGAVDRGLGGA